MSGEIWCLSLLGLLGLIYSFFRPFQDLNLFMVRGLSNSLKRRVTFRWLKMKKYVIFFLQEVHCTKEKESLWTSKWGFTAFFSSFSSASAGVCILFNNNFQFEIIRQFSDQEGRFIIIDMKMDNKILTLVNIYAWWKMIPVVAMYRMLWAMPAMLFDVATLVVPYKNRSLRCTPGFPACKASDLKMIFVG